MRFGRKKLKRVCGARNRRGLPCACKLLYPNGRCRFHGGGATGPRTVEGRKRALLNLKQYRDGTLPIPETPKRGFVKEIQIVRGKAILIPQY